MKRSVRTLAGSLLVAALAVTVATVPAGADTSPTSASGLRMEAPRGAFEILKSRSFVGDDGHLYTRSDLSVGGKVVRDVVAPGGRIGDRWEFVESLPALVGDDHDHGAETAEAESVEAYEMQSGSAAGTTVSADAAANGSSIGPSTYSTLYGYGWCSRNLDAPYRINTARAPGGAVDAIRGGFNVWTSHSSSWMSFVYKGGTSITQASSGDGVNALYFLSSPEGFLGRTWVYGQGTRVTGFDMQLNPRYPLSVGGSGYDLQSLVAHEAGHAAGFGHTSSSGNLMYGGGQPAARYFRSLGSQDRAGLSALYPYGKHSARLVDSSFPVSLKPGALGTVTVTLQNLGATPWGGTRFPALRIRTGGSSTLADSSWLDATVPARSTAATCKGEQVTLTWKVKAPSLLQTHSTTFYPVVGSSSAPKWLTGSALTVTIEVAGTTIGGDGGGDPGGDSCFLFFCW